MKIQRYIITRDDTGGFVPMGNVEGEWCYYSDIEPLLREREELMALVNKMLNIMENNITGVHKSGVMYSARHVLVRDRITGEEER